MRIHDWKPEIGERALVPGGAACAQHVAALEAADVQAIEHGHSGYTPINLEMFNSVTGEFLDYVWYSERFRKWCCSEGGGGSRSLEYIRRRASIFFNCRIAFRVRHLAKGEAAA